MPDAPLFKRGTTSATTESPGAKATSVQRMISAAFGATIVALLVTPFDVVKTRMQTEIIANSKPDSMIFDKNIQRKTALQCIRENKLFGGNGSVKLGLQATSDMRPITSTFDGFVRIAHYEGARGLWKGLAPALVMQAPSTILYYIGYEEIRNSLAPRFSEAGANFYAPLFAGMIARTCTTVAISPLELIRTRMQSGADTTLGSVLKQVRGMVSTNGITSVYRGLGPTLLRDVPFSAIYWSSYEEIKRRFSDATMIVPKSDIAISFASGATAGVIAAVLTTPFDVAKTLQQVVHYSEPGCAVAENRRKAGMSMVGVMRSVLVNDGIRGLFVGLGPRVAKIAPACAIMISSYELGKKFFEGR